MVGVLRHSNDVAKGVTREQKGGTHAALPLPGLALQVENPNNA